MDPNNLLFPFANHVTAISDKDSNTFPTTSSNSVSSCNRSSSCDSSNSSSSSDDLSSVSSTECGLSLAISHYLVGDDHGTNNSSAPMVVGNPMSNIWRDIFNTNDKFIENNNKEKKARGEEKEQFPFLSCFFTRYIKVAEDHRASQDSIWDCNSLEGKVFRRRFCVPYTMFDDLVDEFLLVYGVCQTDLFGHDQSDLRLLVLGALRVLAQHIPFDLVDELTDISAGKHNSFFHLFVKWLATTKYEEVVKFPSTKEEIDVSVNQYSQQFLNGCLGSIDCVHIAWDMCPAGIRSDCTGKEGYPSLAFQVVALPNRKILALTVEQYGTWNNKLIPQHDPTAKMMRTLKKYTNYKFKLFDIDGTLKTWKGVYFICGGGYQSWLVFICLFKD